MRGHKKTACKYGAVFLCIRFYFGEFFKKMHLYYNIKINENQYQINALLLLIHSLLMQSRQQAVSKIIEGD